MSNEEFDRTIPVNPPRVNKNTNPNDHSIEGLKFIHEACNVASQLKTLIPVGTAITIVTVVK